MVVSHEEEKLPMIQTLKRKCLGSLASEEEEPTGLGKEAYSMEGVERS
jgi:hypothetical protein